MSVIILGGGISGLSAAYHLKQNKIDSLVIEKSAQPGGMCQSNHVDGFTFDKGAHLSFTKDEYVQNFFRNSTEIVTHQPTCSNFFEGIWVKHPAQNNLFPLPHDIKEKIIDSFRERPLHLEQHIQDYQQWLEAMYGKYFARRFPERYTKKYWCLAPDQMCTDWIGPRMNRPSLEEIIKGAESQTSTNHYYIQEMRYPKSGGYQSFMNGLYYPELELLLNSKVSEWNVKEKYVVLEGGARNYYEQIISSIPLPELAHIIKDCPTSVRDACQSLCYTSAYFVTMGLDKPHTSTDLWFYIYDEEYLASRVGRHSLKSPCNSRNGQSSYQFEIFYPNQSENFYSTDQLLENVYYTADKLKLFSRNEVIMTHVQQVSYANVTFDLNLKKNRQIIRDFLNRHNIISIGRYGEWDYLWSDQSFLSGKKAAESVFQILR